MEQKERSRKGQHLTRNERIVIETMSRGGNPPRDIADALGRHQRTIEREFTRCRARLRRSKGLKIDQASAHENFPHYGTPAPAYIEKWVWFGCGLFLNKKSCNYLYINDLHQCQM